MNMADSALLNLPVEVRALAEFLELDDRPSAILKTKDRRHEVLTRDGEKVEKVYENAGFRQLAIPGIDVIEVVQELVDHSGSEKRIRSMISRGRLWTLREVLLEWTVLVCDEKAASATGAQQNDRSHDQVDWTCVPVSGLSPWIEYIRDFNWASTALGPMQTWPFELRQCVFSIMHNNNPRLLVWGEQRTTIYNEACVPLFGVKHPQALGRPWKDTWSEVQDEFGPIVKAAYAGKPTTVERMSFDLHRGELEVEETYWDFTMLPVIGENRCTVGLLSELNETTKLVRGLRRRDAILKLGESITTAQTLKELWRKFLDGLKHAAEDVPFALLYLTANNVPEGNLNSANSDSYSANQKEVMLEGTYALDWVSADIPQSFSLSNSAHSEHGVVNGCVQAFAARKRIVLTTKEGSLPKSLVSALQGRTSRHEINAGIVCPIISAVHHEVFGFLIVGLNPRCPLDDEYGLWLQFMQEMLAKTASFISLPAEQRRAQRISDELNDSLAQQLRLTTLKVERSEAKFSRMAALAPTGMFLLDVEGRPLYVNQAYLDLLGLTKEQHASRAATERAWDNQVHPEDFDRVVKAWDRLLEQKSPLTFEYRLKHGWKSVEQATGEEISGERWLLANACPELESDGTISSVQGWLTDISHRKFAESLLNKRLEDALETKRQTERFIDTTCHEIRNPLSAILQSADSISSTLDHESKPMSFEDLTLSQDLVDEISDASESIVLCAQHMRRIVDDILTLSKLDASLLSISPDMAQPPALVAKAMKMYEAEIQHAGIDARVSIEPSYEQMEVDWVVLDSSRVLQIVINLLTNAIKFTQYSDVRKITVFIGASYDKPTGNHHGLSFVPTRSGRPPQTARSEWGDGEDVYIQVAVTDTGRGLSMDEIQALFQRFHQANTKTYKEYGGSGLGLWISRELCELQGGQIGVASGDGKTTFAFYLRAKRWLAKPETETASRPPLRHYASASTSPVAYSRRGSVVLEKQILANSKKQRQHDSISEEPNGTPHNTATENSSEGAKSDGVQSDLHVLVVEDNMINAKVMSQQLRKAGCTVHVAGHGLEALKFLEKTTFCSADTPLSVVLLDLEMPVMDGWTCIKHIRDRQRSGDIVKHVPVIAVTANARSEQISVAIDAGMDSVVTKPFRVPDLVPQMHNLVAEVAERGDG